MEIVFADAELAEHRRYLLRVARQRVRDAAQIEDLVQDTLLAALQGLQRFGGKSSPRTWLTGILLHKIADSVRRDRRAPIVAATVADEDDDDARAQDEPVDWRDPARLLEGRQFIEQLGHQLQALPPQAARAFALREIDGLSLDEVARELGITPGHGALLLHRARHKLRGELAAAA